jgi:hypothetical protein
LELVNLSLITLARVCSAPASMDEYTCPIAATRFIPNAENKHITIALSELMNELFSSHQVC